MVYLNVDSATSGSDSLKADSAPMVYDSLYDTAKMVNQSIFAAFCRFLQDFVKVLHDRAVVYLNVDMSTAGNSSMRALGVPMMYDSLYQTAKLVIV